jgi:hypothetical protein
MVLFFGETPFVSSFCFLKVRRTFLPRVCYSADSDGLLDSSGILRKDLRSVKGAIDTQLRWCFLVALCRGRTFDGSAYYVASFFSHITVLFFCSSLTILTGPMLCLTF